MSEWKPIETAPRDGARFLAIVAADGVRGIVSIIHCHDPGGQARNPRHHYECWVTDFNTPVNPTRWMPLPEPHPPEGEG